MVITQSNHPIYRREYGFEIQIPEGRYACASKILNPKGICSKEDIEAYLVEHPEALVPDPEPPKPTPEQIVEAKRRATMAELETLDKVIPRPLEDLYAKLGIEPHEKVAAIIVRKDELRKELANG